MKKLIIGVLLLGAALPALPQEKSTMTVKDSQVASGVVIVDVQIAGKSVELQCNQGMSKCEQLKRGTYQVVKLPKNRGYYDCQNVEVYAQGADPEQDEKIGAYCMVEK